MSDSYVVIARRYRPQSFEQLIGQEHVARAMAGAILTSRVGHAYLFTGARGVGKTSAARILAKSLNCVQGPTPTPCNECDICQSISGGHDVDVIEIDGASNRGVDEIRQLRQNVAVRPSRARFKIYIIDEVHMLTREAFNALLKTLEEPPEHVKFIFCTTEPEKVPITIHSRCQRFDFAGIQTGSIAERLAQICQAEGVAAEQEALEVLARRAAGSMRDSQSLLEQVLSCCGGRLTTAEVHALLGTAGAVRVDALVRQLAERQPAAVLAELDGAISEGVDPAQLVDQLLGYFRDCLAAGVGCTARQFLYATSSQEPLVKQIAERFGLETILAVMQILDHALQRMRWSTHGRTLLEMALVRICQLEDLDEVVTLAAQLRSGAGPAVVGGAKKKLELLTLPPPASEPTVTRVADPPQALAGPHVPVQAPAEVPAMATMAVAAAAAVTTAADEPVATVDESAVDGEECHAQECMTYEALTSENVGEVWQRALAALGDMVADQAALCESVRLVGPNRVAVAFPAKYKSCKLSLERPDQTARLEQALANIAGGTVRVEFSVLDGPTTHTPPAAAPVRPAVNSRQRLADAAQHPFVQRAMELFAAEPIRVDGVDG